MHHYYSSSIIPAQPTTTMLKHQPHIVTADAGLVSTNDSSNFSSDQTDSSDINKSFLSSDINKSFLRPPSLTFLRPGNRVLSSSMPAAVQKSRPTESLQTTVRSSSYLTGTQPSTTMRNLAKPHQTSINLSPCKAAFKGLGQGLSCVGLFDPIPEEDEAQEGEQDEEPNQQNETPSAEMQLRDLAEEAKEFIDTPTQKIKNMESSTKATSVEASSSIQLHSNSIQQPLFSWWEPSTPLHVCSTSQVPAHPGAVTSVSNSSCSTSPVTIMGNEPRHFSSQNLSVLSPQAIPFSSQGIDGLSVRSTITTPYSRTNYGTQLNLGQKNIRLLGGLPTHTLPTLMSHSSTIGVSQRIPMRHHDDNRFILHRTSTGQEGQFLHLRSGQQPLAASCSPALLSRRNISVRPQAMCHISYRPHGGLSTVIQHPTANICSYLPTTYQRTGIPTVRSTPSQPFDERKLMSSSSSSSSSLSSVIPNAMIQGLEYPTNTAEIITQNQSSTLHSVHCTAECDAQLDC